MIKEINGCVYLKRTAYGYRDTLHHPPENPSHPDNLSIDIRKYSSEPEPNLNTL